MGETQSLGQKGEDKVVSFLREKGYKIRHRNWVSGKKEIDVVAETDDSIVFVEVKTRTEGFLGNPGDLVSREKQKLLILAADSYIQRYNISKESRFDVIIVVVKGQMCDVEDHIESAFYPTLR